MTPFDLAALLAKQNWKRKIRQSEGTLIPGLEFDCLDPDQKAEAAD